MTQHRTCGNHSEFRIVEAFNVRRVMLRQEGGASLQRKTCAMLNRFGFYCRF